MLTIILFLLLVLVAFILVRIEKTRFKTYLSPFILFSIPYLSMVFYQFFIIQLYNWENIGFLFVFSILLYFVTFFVSGHVLYYFFSAQNRTHNLKLNNVRNEVQEKIYSDKLIELIFIVSAIYLLLRFFILTQGLSNYGAIVQEPFQQKYSSDGGFFFRLITMFGGAYFWGLATKKNKRAFFYGLLCFATNLLTFVKGIAFITIISGIIANIIINKRKVKLKTLFHIIIFGISLFFIVYLIEIGIWEPNKLLEKDTYEFIFGKLNVYLISGVQSFNINVTNNHEIFLNSNNIVFAPIVNLIAKFGVVERIDVINDLITYLGNIPSYGQVYVNTNTYIGTLVLYTGLFAGVLPNVIISIFSYYLFYKTISEKSILNISIYAIFSSGLVLSWFEYYYMHTFWFYLIFFYVMLKSVLKVRQYFRREKQE